MKQALTIGIGALALLGMALPSAAADLGARPLPPRAPAVAPIAVYDWSGFYIGAHIGGAWSEKEWGIDPLTAFAPLGFLIPFPGVFGLGSHFADGFLAGGQVGFNVQAGAWVFGVEGQFSWTNADGEHVCVNPGVLTCRTEINWLGTVAGRVGYAFNNVLLYAKGGAAFVDEDHFIFLTGLPGVGALEASTTRTGWMVGAGVEWGFTPNWSAKIEYNYMDFGDDTQDFAFVGFPAVRLDIDQQVHVVKGGINYRFNWGAPAIARY